MVDAIGSTVSLFEMFAREQFARRVAEATTHTSGKGNVLQRLNDTGELFAEHACLDLLALAVAERWERPKRAFARGHVLTHHGAIVDQKFSTECPTAA